MCEGIVFQKVRNQIMSIGHYLVVCVFWFVCRFCGVCMDFRVRYGFKSQTHHEGAEGRKGERRPALALSSVTSPGEPGTWQSQEGASGNPSE